MFNRICCQILFLLVIAGPAYANDSSAGYDNTGIVLSKNNVIEMKRERLFISSDKIRVEYEFFNRSDKDEMLTVAFPMPDVEADRGCSPHDKPPRDFQTLVNNVPIRTELQRRAFFEGRDITKQLADIHVDPDVNKLDADTLRANQLDQLRNHKLADSEGCNSDIYASWLYRETYHWRQVFPARSSTMIKHQYTPSITHLTRATEGTSESCPDNNFSAAVKKIFDRDKADFRSNRAEFPTRSSMLISYILVTGGNWADRKIDDFELIVDKGTQKNLVTFCGQNIEKISPTQFRMHEKNFVPKQNLFVLIIAP